MLAAEGFEVHVPPEPRCCGALQLHSGDDAGGRALAKRTIEAFDGYDLIAVNAAGCGSAMKDYGHILRDEPAGAARRGVPGRVRDVTELLAEHEPVAPRHPLPMRAAYHDACHLAHAQGVRAQPAGAARARSRASSCSSPTGREICCGSAGVYNLLQPEAAGRARRRKVETCWRPVPRP